jgi:SAM-dependent methyltransferase
MADKRKPVERQAQDSKQYAPACERNRSYILEVLRELLPYTGKLLEVGSGSGQHAAWFAPEFPGLLWQPTDTKENLPSIRAWCSEAGAPNLCEPFVLDLSSHEWPSQHYDAIVCINTIHIVAWPLVQNLFAGAGRSLKPGGIFYAYGPYRYRNRPLEPSNENFDEWLQQRDPVSGIREFETVNELAASHGLEFVEDRAMPANNRSICWRKI